MPVASSTGAPGTSLASRAVGQGRFPLKTGIEKSFTNCAIKDYKATKQQRVILL